MRIVIIGAPGAGKGTLCSALVDKGFYHLVASNLIKEVAYAADAPADLRDEGRRAIEEGVLVSDQYISRLVANKLSQLPPHQSVVFDGSPRTMGQAQDLAALTTIDRVVVMSADQELLMARLMGRRVCEDCGRGYHIEFNQPMKTGVCDCCSGHLVQRQDDNAETIAYRIGVFQDKTAPIIDYYRTHLPAGAVLTVEQSLDAQPDVYSLADQVTARQAA